MAGFPEPEPGLVISYAYLWSEEAAQGQIEGRKDRPCAIVLAVINPAEEKGISKTVAVAPITHTPPVPDVAVEIPARIKEHLGLDHERSWVILDELNIFTWPGFDLRSAKGRGGRIDYGFLPPNFFERLIDRFSDLHRQGKVHPSSRDSAPRN